MSRFRRNRLKPSVITLADQARDTGQWERAAEYYREALRRNAQNPPIWVQYGHVLKEAGYLGQAERAYRTALTYDRRVADAHLQLGHVLKIQGKEEEARAAYLRALALDRTLDGASFELAGLGWSSAHFSELRAVFGTDDTGPQAPTTVNGTSPEHSVIPTASEQADGRKQDDVASHPSPENPPTAMGESSGHIGSCSSAPTEAELAGLGWSSAHFSELRAVFGTDVTGPQAPAIVNGTSPEHSVIPAASEQAEGRKQDDVASHPSPENPPTSMGESSGHIGSRSSAPAESEDAEILLESGLFDKAWYIEKYRDAQGVALDPILHYLRRGAAAGLDPHPLFDSDWYLATNPDVAAHGVNPLVHFVCTGAVEGRAPHPLFDAAWYLKTNLDVAKANINPLAHYLSSGALEGRAPNPLLQYVFAGASARRAPLSARSQVHVPDLFELRGLTPRGRIAVVLHLYYPDLWEEIRQAIEHISQPFDLFVSLVDDTSDHMRTSITQAFPNSYVFDFENRGRDIGPFLVLLQSGVLFQYELVCKLHTKRSPHRQDGDEWRGALIGGVLGDSCQSDQIISCFRSDPDIGMVIAEGNIYRGSHHWASNQKLLTELLPRIGISTDVRDRAFPGGSIFWIRPFLLRTLASTRLNIEDFEPEPVNADGSLPHAVERMFGLVCEDAGMRFVESNRITDTVKQPPDNLCRVHIIAFYLPQFHPIHENNTWWGEGFTEWANVTRAKPLFAGHRQPRLPSDLGFYDLRVAEVREAQAELARRYGLSAFCYYYYWFNGRRVLERPLDEVLASGRPDFPFLICWANEPWTRNWDGLNRDILLPQTYEPGWTKRFARDIAPLLHDRRYFRLNGKPMLLIYRIGHIPGAGAAMWQLRLALAEEGITEVHLAAAWAWFPDEQLPKDPGTLGLDAYFEFPPHYLASQPLQTPRGLSHGFTGDLFDYNRTVTAAIAGLDEPTEGRRHRGLMAAWDSTPRHGARAHLWHGATPTSFRRWLRAIVAHERRLEGERVIFINAWNEWAEGTCLEPDTDFGLGWLEAVASAADVEWSTARPSGAGNEASNSKAVELLTRHGERKE